MYIVVGTVYISQLSQEKRGEDMHILLGTVYISHLSQEKRGKDMSHSCRYCLHFTLITREERKNICTFL